MDPLIKYNNKERLLIFYKIYDSVIILHIDFSDYLKSPLTCLFDRYTIDFWSNQDYMSLNIFTQQLAHIKCIVISDI